MDSAVLPTTLVHWESGQASNAREDFLAVEEPLEIRVRGRSIAITMRTPGQDAELAAGFLLTEGLIQHRREVLEIAHCRSGETAIGRNIVNVFLAASIRVDFERLTRHVFASSSCGLCGKATIDAVRQHFPAINSETTFQPDLLVSFPGQLRQAQNAFAQTGGLHAAALFDSRGELLVLREDIGRHNAVDKVIGYGLLEQLLPLNRHALLVSGRASFEIMQKALAAQISLVCAISAPSSLAVEFAQESGQTLVGFLRNGAFNLYAHPERVIVDCTRL